MINGTALNESPVFLITTLVLSSLNLSASIPFVLRRETRWEGQVDPIKNRVRSKSKLSLN
jgi:hypothetical protein